MYLKKIYKGDTIGCIRVGYGTIGLVKFSSYKKKKSYMFAVRTIILDDSSLYRRYPCRILLTEKKYVLEKNSGKFAVKAINPYHE